MNRAHEEQFLKAYDEYADAIFRHCFFRVGKDRDRAHDLTQDVFMKTWQYMAKGNEVENIRALLYRIANNAIIDWYRKKKESSLDVLLEVGFEPSQEKTERMIDTLDGERLLVFLDALEEPYQTAVRMRYMDELGPKEIAEIIEETENVISVRIHRGIKKLQEMIETHYGELL